MVLRLYNTLTNSEETFEPLDPEGRVVTYYTCGPTVYDYAHIGNFRTFLCADVLRRTLEMLGYEVRQVMNLTDVGHMTDDEVADGGGQDKMEIAQQRLTEAKKSGKLPAGVDVDPGDPYAIADFYILAFMEDARALGMKIVFEAEERPELMPRPTRYIEQMISLVEQLIARDHAYVASDGVVYFDVRSFPEYGNLSGNTPDRIRPGEGGRVDEATQAVKRYPADFMLWKPDPTHLMRWPSPWGEGYPGWHLECSVMAATLLGADTNGVIDLHSGGEDNIFPHHECEIAQTRCATGEAAFARYWFHSRHLMVEGNKMSKSKGTFLTVRDLLAKGASPAAIRLELIRTHYRSNANFTFQGLKDSQRQVGRWKKLAAWLETHGPGMNDASVNDAGAGPGTGPLATALDAFKQALARDLNIAGAIGVLNEAASAHTVDAGPDDATALAGELDALRTMDTVLGVLALEHEASLDAGGLDVTAVEAKITERERARGAREWSRADEIRDELLSMGVVIKDDPGGTTWSRTVD